MKKPMKIEIVRFQFTDKSTIGRLYVDGVFECYTLEDKIRDMKIKGITAIPAGIYKVIIDMSGRFKRLLPLLINVLGFSGIRIHIGNKPEDTEGCILVGQSFTTDWIGSSGKAFDALFAKMQAASEITLTIH